MFFVFDWTTGQLQFAAKYRDHVNYARKARANFKRVYGKKMMYKKFPDLYYEAIPVPAAGKDT